MKFIFNKEKPMKKIFYFLVPILMLFSSLGFAQDSNIILNSDIENSVEPSPTIPRANNISLDIKGMDMVDVLKMLALRAKINLVIGKNVKGQVSMFLRDVDIWDAFEIILLANDLAYDIDGDIVNVMSQTEYEKRYGIPYKEKKKIEIINLKYAKAKDMMQALVQIKSDVGKVVLNEASNSLIIMDIPERIEVMRKIAINGDGITRTEIFNINYADPQVLSGKIKSLLTKGLGSIEIDERTDKLAITDTPDAMKKIANLVRAFDEKPLQVLIDARIIELKPSDKLEMGIDFDYWMEKHSQISAPFAGVTGDTKLSIGTVNTTVAKEGDYNAVLDILRTVADTNILSSPRIMVVDGQEASMLVGSKEAYLTSSTTQVGESASTSETVNFVDVGIKLYVTPEISRDGHVTMKIRPEVSSSELVNFGTATAPKQIPIVTTSEAETTVVVKDGTTIIIGGLRKDEKIKTVKKIPILGDLPILGHLARNTSDEVSSTDLVILLTPYIVTGDEAITDMAEMIPKDGVIITMPDGELKKERVNINANLE